MSKDEVSQFKLKRLKSLEIDMMNLVLAHKKLHTTMMETWEMFYGKKGFSETNKELEKLLNSMQKQLKEEDKMGLTFDQLREANLKRLPLFKNKQGEYCHAADGSDWSIAEWLLAVVGELGELANQQKKIKRGDFVGDELKQAKIDLAKEFGDVQTYFDILAFRCGIDLGQATTDKFNEISKRVGCDVRL